MDEACRICLEVNPLDIFSPDCDAKPELRELIYIASGIKILSTDEISKKVCYRCCDIAVKLFKYRKIAAISGRILKSGLNKPVDDISSIKENIIRNTQIVLENQQKNKQEAVIKRDSSEIQKNDKSRETHLLPLAKANFKPSKQYPYHRTIKEIMKKHPNIRLPPQAFSCHMMPEVWLEPLKQSELQKLIRALPKKQVTKKKKTKQLNNIITNLTRRLSTENTQNKENVRELAPKKRINGQKKKSEASAKSVSHKKRRKYEGNGTKPHPQKTELTMHNMNEKNTLLSSLELEPALLRPTGKTDKIFICNVCETIWNTQSDLSAHIKLHLKCKLCNRRFKTLDLLDEHMNSKHIEENNIPKKNVDETVPAIVEVTVETKNTMENTENDVKVVEEPIEILCISDSETEKQSNSEPQNKRSITQKIKKEPQPEFESVSVVRPSLNSISCLSVAGTSRDDFIKAVYAREYNPISKATQTNNSPLSPDSIQFNPTVNAYVMREFYWELTKGRMPIRFEYDKQWKVNYVKRKRDKTKTKKLNWSNMQTKGLVRSVANGGVKEPWMDFGDLGKGKTGSHPSKSVGNARDDNKGRVLQQEQQQQLQQQQQQQLQQQKPQQLNTNTKEAIMQIVMNRQNGQVSVQQQSIHNQQQNRVATVQSNAKQPVNQIQEFSQQYQQAIARELQTSQSQQVDRQVRRKSVVNRSVVGQQQNQQSVTEQQQQQQLRNQIGTWAKMQLVTVMQNQYQNVQQESAPATYFLHNGCKLQMPQTAEQQQQPLVLNYQLAQQQQQRQQPVQAQLNVAKTSQVQAQSIVAQPARQQLQAQRVVVRAPQQQQPMQAPPFVAQTSQQQQQAQAQPVVAQRPQQQLQQVQAQRIVALTPQQQQHRQHPVQTQLVVAQTPQRQQHFQAQSIVAQAPQQQRQVQAQLVVAQGPQQQRQQQVQAQSVVVQTPQQQQRQNRQPDQTQQVQGGPSRQRTLQQAQASPQVQNTQLMQLLKRNTDIQQSTSQPRQVNQEVENRLNEHFIQSFENTQRECDRAAGTSRNGATSNNNGATNGVLRVRNLSELTGRQ